MKNKYLLGYLSGAIGLLAYLPFLYASQFMHPLGIHEWDWISSFNGSDGGFAFGDIQRYWYQQIGGRYTSTFLLGTLPMWYSLSAFRGVILFVLLMYPLVLGYVLTRTGMGGLGWVIGSSTWMLFLHQLTNCYDSLLRFTCMPIYHLGSMGVLLVASMLYRCTHPVKSNYKALAAVVLIGLVTVGTNEIALVQVAVLLVFSLAWSYVHQKRHFMPLLLATLLIGLGMSAALLAPGNFQRMDMYATESSFIQAILLTGAVSVYLWMEWFANSLFLPFLLIICWIYLRYFPTAIPILRHAKYWLVASLIWVPASLFPLLYGTAGASLPERVVDLLFLQSSILMSGFVLSLCQKQIDLLQRPIENMFLGKAMGILIFYFAVHLFFDGLSLDREPENRNKHYLALVKVESNIGKAYLQVFNGTPRRYNEEMNRIEQAVHVCKTQSCTVAPLATPDFIGYDPLYDRLHSTGERGMARALGNQTVEVVQYGQE